MKNNELRDFSDEWIIAFEMCKARPQSAKVITRIFEMLKKYELTDIQEAIAYHVNHDKFAPTPSDIIAKLESLKAQHIGKNEAWSMCYRLIDEAETSVITQQMREAWRGCYVLIKTDKTGARMAFNEIYERLCKEDTSIRWEVQPGTDDNLRYNRVKEAVNLGRLGDGMLGVHGKLLPTISMDELMVLALEHNPESKHEELKAKWHSLGQMIKNKREYSADEEELRLKRLAIALEENEQILKDYPPKQEVKNDDDFTPNAHNCNAHGCYSTGTISGMMGEGISYYCQKHFRQHA